MPGAEDDVIFADIAQNIGSDVDDVRAALTRLIGIAKFDPVRRLEAANAFLAEGGPALVAIVRVILLCCYRDDGVIRWLGQEPRPYFPQGDVVEQDGWSLQSEI